MFRSVAARSEFVAVVFATTADYWSRLVGYSMLGAGKFVSLASLFVWFRAVICEFRAEICPSN